MEVMIHMNSKYYEMHKDFVSFCCDQNLHLIPGRVAYLEARDKKILRAEKTFFLFQKEFEALQTMLEEGLGAQYHVTKAPADNEARWIRIERKDILAASMDAIFRYPKSRLYPRFIIRELKTAADGFLLLQNKKEKQIPAAILERFIETAYAGAKLYVPEDIASFFGKIYEMANPLTAGVATYEIFDENIDAEQLVAEAKARGILTKEQKERFRAFETWKKEIEKPATKSYFTYQNELLGLKLDDEM